MKVSQKQLRMLIKEVAEEQESMHVLGEVEAIQERLREVLVVVHGQYKKDDPNKTVSTALQETLASLNKLRRAIKSAQEAKFEKYQGRVGSW